MKYLSLIIICGFLSSTLFSQDLSDNKSTYHVFLDKNYEEIKDRTGAVYERIFLGVDSVKTTYEVRDYTVDGSLIFIASSSSKTSLIRDGRCTWFNSKLKPVKTGYFIKGVPDSILTEYYNNGQM